MPAEPASILAHQLRRLAVAAEGSDSQKIADSIYQLLQMDREAKLATSAPPSEPSPLRRIGRQRVKTVQGL